MMLKRILPILCAMLILTMTGGAQAPTFNFTVTADTAIESNATVIAGYVKSSIPLTANDSVLIIRTAGNPRSSHMDASSQFIVRFASGEDSSAFSITLYDDTFPELPEHVTYTLTTYGTFDTIGINHNINFVLLDNDLAATIGFVIDTGSAWLHDGSFQVCETIYNPNPFYVRYRRFTYDGYTDSSFYHTTAGGGVNYFYDRDTAYAPPGTSTLCQNITIVPNSNLYPDQTLVCVLFNIDANNISDSLFFFTIKNDNFYNPPSVSFDVNNMTVVKDTAVLIGIPVTTINPNHLSFSFIVDTFKFSSVLSYDSAAMYHVYLNNNFFGHAGGLWHDTLWVNLLDNHHLYDTSTIVFRIKGVNLNTSPDTLFYLTIIDTGSLIVSFKGAGFAHLKDDSVGYVQVYTSAPVRYPVTASVTYLNGNAVAGVDYLWKDTVVTFLANLFDTVSLPVVMLKNHIHDGNKQIIFLLSNVNPTSVLYDIIQYTFTIIDNDSTASYPSGLTDIDNNASVTIYPNPFNSYVYINTSLSGYRTIVYDMMGKTIFTAESTANEKLDLSNLSEGVYIIKISGNDFSYTRKLIKSRQ